MNEYNYYGRISVYWKDENKLMEGMDNYPTMGLGKLYPNKDNWGDIGEHAVTKATICNVNDDFYNRGLKLTVYSNELLIDYCMNLAKEKNVTVIYRFYNEDEQEAGYVFYDIKKKSKATVFFYDPDSDDFKNVLNLLDIKPLENSKSKTVSIKDLRKN